MKVEGRTSEQKARMALGDSSCRIRMHSSYAWTSVRMSLFSAAKRVRALLKGFSLERVLIERAVIRTLWLHHAYPWGSGKRASKKDKLPSSKQDRGIGRRSQE